MALRWRCGIAPLPAVTSATVTNPPLKTLARTKQKQDLLAKYTSDSLLQQQEEARALLNKK